MPKFARFDPTQPAPYPVRGWYDTDLLHYPKLPDASQLIAVSDADWQAHFIRRSGWVVENGKLVQPPPLVETPAPAPQAAGLPQAGVQVSSATCPGVDGLYACDDAAVTTALTAALHIKLHGSFPG